jgi:hypothetical protein
VRRFAWPVALPSLLGGVLAAHALAYRLTIPPAQRQAVLAETGHVWFRYLPLVGALALALLLIGLVRRVLAPRSPTPAAWPFAVLPPLVLALQEQLERLSGSGHLAFETPVVAGVLLAVPIGLAAYVVARALLAVSDNVGAALRSRPSFACAPPPTAVQLALSAPVGSLRLTPLLPRGPPRRDR